MTKVTFQAELSGKIKCKVCGFEVHTHNYQRHVMAMHRD